MSKKSGKFGSVFGFLMTAIGYAVGLGAIWRQPYLMGANGGGAFLIIMIVLSIIIGIPLLLCELTIGRTVKTTPIKGYQELEGKKSKWQSAGWLGVIAGILLMSYYSSITGTVLYYLVLSITKGFHGMSGDEAPVYVFGSYLSDESSLTQTSLVMTLSNLVIAVLAGIAIFPAVFSYGVNPEEGSSLVFQTMPVLFGKMDGGRIFGTCFFLCLFCAAYSTCLGLIEGAAASLGDRFGIEKKKMVWICVVLMFLIGIIPTLSSTPILEDVRVWGLDLYTLIDYITMNVCIPMGAMITVLYCGYKFTFARFKTEANKGATIFKITAPWKILICVVCPVVIVIISILGFASTFL